MEVYLAGHGVPAGWGSTPRGRIEDRLKNLMIEEIFPTRESSVGER